MQINPESLSHEAAATVTSYKIVTTDRQRRCDAAEIEGVPCFSHLRDIRPAVDSVLLMTSPTVTSLVLRECVEAGIKRVWFYRGAGQGALTEGALQICHAHGIQVIPGECPFMFFDRTPWFHRFHGLVRKIVGAYPR